MTKKDYELIAGEISKSVLNNEDSYQAEMALTYLARSLSTRLAEENPRFDRARFLTACGVTE